MCSNALHLLPCQHLQSLFATGLSLPLNHGSTLCIRASSQVSLQCLLLFGISSEVKSAKEVNKFGQPKAPMATHWAWANIAPAPAAISSRSWSVHNQFMHGELVCRPGSGPLFPTILHYSQELETLPVSRDAVQDVYRQLSQIPADRLSGRAHAGDGSINCSGMRAAA
ncbi:hypothetical protein DFH27DRAFT_288430 [Peziza echinospora]|nr:hypothetical protein DFH27DRAFT_288430 [Peziza echinospora]